MNHFHAFYDSDNYGGTIIDVNLPCPHPDATCDLPDRYVPADTYDDFIASDVLAAFIRDPHTTAQIQMFTSSAIGDHPWLVLNGEILLTPEQAAVLSPLFPSPPEG